ncbi:hypothetical protein D3C81_1443500 [compost metagenome]
MIKERLGIRILLHHYGITHLGQRGYTSPPSRIRAVAGLHDHSLRLRLVNHFLLQLFALLQHFRYRHIVRIYQLNGYHAGIRSIKRSLRHIDISGNRTDKQHETQRQRNPLAVKIPFQETAEPLGRLMLLHRRASQQP